MTVHPPTRLRRAVLAVTLLDEGHVADLQPRDEGVLHDVPGGVSLVISWTELVLAAADDEEVLPDRVLQRRVGRWVRLRVALHDLVHGADDLDAARASILAKIRVRALPQDHAVHPGPSWPRRAVMGGALDVGLALKGYDDDGRPDPEGVGVVPAGILVATGIDVSTAHARAERHLADMAALAGERLLRSPSAVLRPLGDADVPTLLAARELRAALVDGMGMRSAAVPSRRRGWLDLGRIDPAFAVTAAQLSDPDDRGFARPVLITCDEVALVRGGGDAVAQSLADPAPDEFAHHQRRRA